MASLPASGYLSDNARNEGEMKTGFEDQRDFINQLPGGSSESDVEIASGSVTPNLASSITVDSEGATGNDDLDNIVPTNYVDGQIIRVRQLVAGRDVTLRHAQGGSGQLSLLGAANFTLGETDVYSILRLETGSPNTWVELRREYGNQQSAARTFLGLGTAAVANTGTGGSNVPLVSNIQGRQTIPIVATALGIPASGGATYDGVVDFTTLQLPVVSFSDGVADEAYFGLTMPKSYDGGVLRYRIQWRAPSASTNAVVWELAAAALADSGSLSGASYGTPVTVTDSNNANDDLNTTPESGDLTPSGSPAGTQLMAFRLRRLGADAGDTLAAEAGFLAMSIYYSTSALNDA